jgi:preprotein translocase subunit SecD
VRRRYWAPLLVTVGLGVFSMIAVVVANYRPVLGLDLRGGVSVVLRPARAVSNDVLNQAKNIITDRVDALGVAEPNITTQGGDIVVELPGVKDTQRAEKLVGQTAQLTFREVQQNLPPTGNPPTTPPDQITSTGTVVLAQRDQTTNQVVQRYQLGPVLLNGTIIKNATAVLGSTGQWQVNFTTTASGSGAFDAMAAKEYQKAVAIVLDNNVVSAPVINATAFHGSGQITGTFTEDQAKNLALVLNYGSLPVPLQQLSVQTVSATLGSSSLKAGLAAGVGGLILVLLYIVFYYRALGLVALFGLMLTGMYIERLKDEIRAGKTVRSSVDRGFSRAFRTIVAADAVSLIGAVLLYLLAVGPVRGFAFMLGLSTLIDVFTSFFFTRPLVILMGRNRMFTEARVIGVARGLAAPAAEAAA